MKSFKSNRKTRVREPRRVRILKSEHVVSFPWQKFTPKGSPRPGWTYRAARRAAVNKVARRAERAAA